jgi:hypothetical protein
MADEFETSAHPRRAEFMNRLQELLAEFNVGLAANYYWQTGVVKDIRIIAIFSDYAIGGINLGDWVDANTQW